MLLDILVKKLVCDEEKYQCLEQHVLLKGRINILNNPFILKGY